MGNLAAVMSKFLLLSAHFLRKDTHPLHQKAQDKKYIIKNQNCSCQSRIFNGCIRRWFLMENYFGIDQMNL